MSDYQTILLFITVFSSGGAFGCALVALLIEILDRKDSDG